MSKMEVQSNNEKQQTVNTPKLVNVKLTVDKPNELVDTDNWNVEYTSTRTQQFTDTCQIKVKVADSSESSDHPAGSEHRFVELFNVTVTTASTGNKVVWTLQSASNSSLKVTVEEEMNFGSKRMQRHYGDGDSNSLQFKQESKPNSSLDDELNSKSNWKFHKNSEQDFDKFEKNWMKLADFQVVSEQEGDLFAMPNKYSLATCVGEDFNMGSGIATRFRSQFKNLGDLYSQKQKQGGVAFLKDNERYVYYLVTKRVSSGKPTYLTMWKSLRHLRLKMEEHGVKKLAVPRLGSGQDRLEWVKVKAMLETIFEGMMDVEIVVCNFKQEEEPPGVLKKPIKILHKCKIVNVAKRLVEIERYTILIYLGCEDDTITDTMKSIDEKHPFIHKHKMGKRTKGTAFVVEFREYALYGFIVRKSKNDPLDFMAFERCAQQLNRENKKRNPRYEYVAMEAFKDSRDDLMLDKLVNILRCIMFDVELDICWPEELVHLIPHEITN